MKLVQMNARIPESLDSQIKSLAKHLRVKNRELIIHLLNHGLVAISGFQDYPDQSENTDEINRTRCKRTGGRSRSASELNDLDCSDMGKSSSNRESPQPIDNSENRLSLMESLFEAQSCQLEELQKSVAELSHTMLSLSAPLPAQQIQSQESEAVASPDLEIARPLEKPKDLPEVQKSQSVSVHLSNNLEDEEEWLTFAQAYALAREVGYDKCDTNFRLRLLDPKKSEFYQAEWGFEVKHPNTLSSPAQKPRIRLRPGGKVAQALLAKSQGQTNVSVLFDTSNRSLSNPNCSRCHARMRKHVMKEGVQKYKCPKCHKTILGNADNCSPLK